jgi:hypothetical protein
VRRVLALALVGLCLTAPAAAAQVVTLRGFPGPSLSQGPVLAGERVAWAQTLCVEDCDPDLRGFSSERFEVLAAGSGAPRRLFRARVDHATGGAQFSDESYSFLLSEQVFATVHRTQRGDETEGESGSAGLRAGVPGGARERLVSCQADFFDGAFPVALDGSTLLYDPSPCDDLGRLVLRDLATGTTRTLPDAPTRSGLRVRGRFAAWVADGMLVVYDHAAGTVAYSAPAAGVLAFDLDSDGSVAAVSGRASRPCSTGRLLRYTVATPDPTDLGVPVCATGVRIDAGRIVFLGWEGFTRTLRLVGDGSIRDLVRFGRVRPGAFDLQGDRLAWAARDCGGGQGIFTAPLADAPLADAPLADAPLDAGSINCRARFRSGTVPVRRGIATARLRCPRGCGGELRLRHMGAAHFSLLRGEREVRVRLNARARARLARLGSLRALARLVTRNRAGDRQARSREVTLRTAS